MPGKVLNIKDFSPLKLCSLLKGKCHAICHYSYNLLVQHKLWVWNSWPLFFC